MIPRAALSLAACAGVVLVVGVGCTRDPAPSSLRTSAETSPTPTNRVELPEDAIANLGITFAQARRGKLKEVLSVPGHLEVPQTHRFEIRSPVAGVVRAITPNFAVVKKGEVVAELVTEELGQIQRRLLDAMEDLIEAEIEVQIARGSVEPLRDVALVRQAAADSADQRVSQAAAIHDRAVLFSQSATLRLQGLRTLAKTTVVPASELLTAERDALDAMSAALEAEQRRTATTIEQRTQQLDATLADVSATTAEQRVAARKAARAGARARLERGIDVLSALSGISPEQLLAEDADGAGPWFITLTSLPLASPGDGVVVNVHASDGAWLEPNQPIVEVVDTGLLLFEGAVPEKNLAVLLAATAVEVTPIGAAYSPLPATLVGRGIVADGTSLMVPVHALVPSGESRIPPGVSATARLIVSEAEFEEILVPEACLVLDDLETIVFRRDPSNLNIVIRTPVAIGSSSGGWVEVLSGVGEGESLVLAGVRQLKQIRLGGSAGSGHFHADGTWHEGDE